MDLLLAVLERVYTYSERYLWSVMSVTGTAGENMMRLGEIESRLPCGLRELYRGQTLGKVSSPFASLFPNLRQYER